MTTKQAPRLCAGDYLAMGALVGLFAFGVTQLAIVAWKALTELLG